MYKHIRFCLILALMFLPAQQPGRHDAVLAEQIRILDCRADPIGKTGWPNQLASMFFLIYRFKAPTNISDFFVIFLSLELVVAVESSHEERMSKTVPSRGKARDAGVKMSWQDHRVCLEGIMLDRKWWCVDGFMLVSIKIIKALEGYKLVELWDNCI